MITWLDGWGAAVVRASWQAAMLAVLVALLLRVLGERVAPRWRYLLWTVVLVRLLWLATPASAWSAFNLVRWQPTANAPRVVRHDTGEATKFQRAADVPGRAGAGLSSGRGGESNGHPAMVTTSAEQVPLLRERAVAPLSSADDPHHLNAVFRVLSAVGVAGALVLALRQGVAALVLHRRLRICRPVTDSAVLGALETACREMGHKRHPGLFVTPEAISPCLIGTWKPRIIVPEALVTDRDDTPLRHVLAHEVAHLVRGDLWTNWLLLAAPIVHWFNPAAWWTVRALHAEREAACDELALAALGEHDRAAYAATIVNLAASLAPSGMAPAMIGLIGSRRRLTLRVERLVRSTSVAPLRTSVAASLVLSVALVGLTDATPPASAGQPLEKQAAPQPQKADADAAKTVTLRGRCVDDSDGSAIAGARVRLFRAEGAAAPVTEFAQTVSDRAGHFEFPNLAASRIDDPLDRLTYLVFAESEDRPIGWGGMWLAQVGHDRAAMEVRIPRERTTLAGTVHDVTGHAVAGATVALWDVDSRPVTGVLSATTNADGRFTIARIPYYQWMRADGDGQRGLTVSVSHPDHFLVRNEVRGLPRVVKLMLPAGAKVTGTVLDGVTGQPAVGALVVAERLSQFQLTSARTNATGHFAMVLPEDRFNVFVRAHDRVCVALTDQECLAGQTRKLPPFTLSRGGLIVGRVLNAITRQPIAVTVAGEPIALGLIGPSEPLGKTVSAARMARVDREGRFVLHAAPGENFPYLVNYQGDRMGWNTTNQPPVVVKEGETTEYDMLVTPKVTPAETAKAARALVATLSSKPTERTEQILNEFRKLAHTVDETDLWCLLMRELVAVGRDAVPQLCAELDRTTKDRALRRLAFALRAIGDPRGVPALIRAIPRTLVPASSDYGLIVADANLAGFMQQHALQPGKIGGTHFYFGRPPRELFSALHKLTGQDFEDAELSRLSRSTDPRRQILQRRRFDRHAQQWQAWWEAHWREFTDDATYQKVNLTVDDAPLPPASTVLGPKARVEGTIVGLILSPAIEGNAHASHFYDLDTGATIAWPASIPRDEARFDNAQLAAWAAEHGVDLMCVTHRAADGKETFVLRSFGMKTWEIGPRDQRNIDKLVAAGTLPGGHDTGELLMDYDEASKQPVPDANPAFVYITREGNIGVIETTDRITRTADLSGMLPGAKPSGVGFFKGVKFNLKEIIP